MRVSLGKLLAATLLVACALSPAWSAPEKVLRYAFPVAETGFDPAQLNDLYSRIVTANIFEALYGYDYLARPAKVKPVLADGMPEVSPDFRTFTVKMKRDVYFADDPAFGGVLAMGYSGSFGQQNHSRFKNDRFDELYSRQAVMADGPVRDAVIRGAVRILIAYMPIKVRVHRIGTDMMQPWVVGYRRHPNAREFWQYVDIDTSKIPKK